jgi:hypothetical protein
MHPRSHWSWNANNSARSRRTATAPGRRPGARRAPSRRWASCSSASRRTRPNSCGRRSVSPGPRCARWAARSPATARSWASPPGLALCGALAVTAFLVIALGDLLNNYWLGALVVGLALLAVGGVLARNAVADLKRGVVPEQTLGSLREDAAWAKQETREVKRELTR